MSDPVSFLDPHSDAPMEYLGANGPEPGKSRRRPRPWAPVVAGVIAFFLVLLVAGALVGDWAARSIEMRALISQVELSEKAMGDTQAALAVAIEGFRANPTPTEADKAAFEDELKKAAIAGVEGVKRGGDLVQAVKVLPWHADVKAAQTAYLAHNQAWQDYLTKASTDATEFGKKQDAVNSTFQAAEGPMRTAVPRPDLFRLAERVDAIYAPSEDSGPGQQA